MIKIIPLATGLVSASALTQLFFNLNLKTFLMSETGGGSAFITLRELFNMGGITNYGIGGGVTLLKKVQDNVANNWMSTSAVLIGAKALPKIISKIGITRQANQLSKSIGLGSIIQL